MPIDPRACPHESFEVRAHVERIQSATIPERLAAIKLHVGLTCKDCLAQFWFPGLPTGTDFAAPTTSTDGFTLTAPVVQQNCRVQLEQGMVKVVVNNTDALKGHKP